MATNLPITSNAPQAAMPAAKKTAGSNAPDDAQGAQPFMELLARQIKGAQLKDAKPDADLIAEAVEKNTPVVAVGEQPADDKSATAVTGTSAQPAALPGEMLAALLIPQETTPAATAVSAKGDDVTPATARLPAGMAIRTEAPGKQTSSDALAPTGKNEPVARTPGQAVFAAALAETATRATDAEGNNALREMLPGAIQSGAATLTSVQTVAAQFTAPAQQPVVQAAITTQVGRERWGEEFSQRITWLATPRQDQTAELHLNPPQLGPLDVVLKVSGDQATALFTSPHAAVRDAIEQALPRLRDMLADNGITLGNTTVSDQTPRENGSEASRHRGSEAGGAVSDPASTAEIPLQVSQIQRHDGIVDTFA